MTGDAVGAGQGLVGDFTGDEVTERVPAGLSRLSQGFDEAGPREHVQGLRQRRRFQPHRRSTRGQLGLERRADDRGGLEQQRAVQQAVVHGSSFVLGGQPGQRRGQVDARAHVVVRDFAVGPCHRGGDCLPHADGPVRRLWLPNGGSVRRRRRYEARRIARSAFDVIPRDRAAAVIIGVFGGFIVGLTSVGSGVFFGLTLLVMFPLRAHKVVGTDIFHAALLLYIAGAAHWAAGNIDFSILGWLLLGSIPGVLIGGHLTLSIPEQRLRLLLAGVLGLAGIKLLNVPFAGTIVVVVLSAGGVALLVWLARHSWTRLRTRGDGVSPAPD